MVDRAIVATADLSPAVQEVEEHLPTVEVPVLAGELVHQHQEVPRYETPSTPNSYAFMLRHDT